MNAIARPGTPAARRWMGTVFSSPWRVRAHGLERLPAEGGALLVANHMTMVDGPLVYTVVRRGLHMLVKKEMFSGVVGRLLLDAGQIPIDRTGNDRTALSTATEVLRRGDLVGMFPEGTRGGGMPAAVRGGAAFLAVGADVPVVPVAVLGTRRPGDRSRFAPPPGRRIDVVFGAPVRLADQEGLSGRERRQLASDELQALLAGHIEAACRLTGQRLP